jgi:hypothetical protein
MSWPKLLLGLHRDLDLSRLRWVDWLCFTEIPETNEMVNLPQTCLPPHAAGFSNSRPSLDMHVMRWCSHRLRDFSTVGGWKAVGGRL